jgi:hypothetical protein
MAQVNDMFHPPSFFGRYPNSKRICTCSQKEALVDIVVA